MSSRLLCLSKILTRTCRPKFALHQWSHLPVRSVHTGRSGKTGVSEWRGIVTRFLPIGICLVAVMQWRAMRKREGNFIEGIEVECYKALPLKVISRWWGVIADVELPTSMRPYILGWYIKWFNVKLNEAANEDLKSYPTIVDFFVRNLKEGVRIIDGESDLVSPCDGTVLHVCETNSEKIEQVKGITYSIEAFLGEKVCHKFKTEPNTNQKNSLYQITIYLAPGDYHRFHSPADWNVTHRRHICGELLSVNPFIAKRVPGLFVLNERAVYFGEWKHGFFSYAAVGATNVGSIRVYFDKSLCTNVPHEKHMDYLSLSNNTTLNKGEMIGEFRMGSTIVMLFEAPPNFCFTVKPGDRVQMGESIACVGRTKYIDTIKRNSTPVYSR